MAPQLWKVPMNRILLPGSHDSGAYGFHRRGHLAQDAPPVLHRLHGAKRTIGTADVPFGKRMVKLCRTQRGDVAKQLSSGVRYLDLRVACEGGCARVRARRRRAGGRPDGCCQLHLCHAMLGPEFGGVLRQVHHFLRANSGEVVILDMNHLYSFTPGCHRTVATVRLGSGSFQPNFSGATSRVPQWCCP